MEKLTVLHLEDNDSDAFFVQRALEKDGFNVAISRASSTPEFLNIIGTVDPDFILLDHGISNTSNELALKLVREKCPGIPVIVVSRTGDREQVVASLKAGASDYILKDHLWQLTTAIHRLQDHKPAIPTPPRLLPNLKMEAMQLLLHVVQELSMARDLATIMEIVRYAARELTGADGATFVLREKDLCYYAEENAIAPLWKGKRFPMSICISGWVMQHHKTAVIDDIYVDSRIPAEAYRPTFVKSLLMVPIRTNSPIGAIGNYWAQPHQATADEIELIEALANTTSVAMENVQVYSELEQRVQERTTQLEMANRELQSFSYSVSHDLRTPLCGIGGYADLLALKLRGNPDREVDSHLSCLRQEVNRMSTLIEDMIRLSKFTQIELRREETDLTLLAKNLAERLPSQFPGTTVQFSAHPGMTAQADAGLIQIVLENLLSNAWKYSSKRAAARIEFGVKKDSDQSDIFFVQDNGAGFNMEYASNLFTPFQRLHSDEEFKGTGIGLATVHRIIARHGGRIWAEAEEGHGATFYFTLPPLVGAPQEKQ